MAFSNTSSNSSSKQNWGQVNDLARDFKSKERVTIYKDDTGTRRVLEGKGKDGFYGFKVSPEGVDVYTATDDQLIFNSNQNVFKIVGTGVGAFLTKTITGPAGGGWVTGHADTSIAHGLSFIPAYLTYIELFGGSLQRFSVPLTLDNVVSNVEMSSVRYHVSVDATNLIFNTDITGYLPAGKTAVAPAITSLKYFLLQESAS